MNVVLEKLDLTVTVSGPRAHPELRSRLVNEEPNQGSCEDDKG